MTRARKTNVFFLGLVTFYIIACTIIMPLIPAKYLNINSSIVLSQLFVLIPGFIYVVVSRGKAIREIECRFIGIGNMLLLVLFTLAMVPVISFINAFSMMFAKNYLAEQLDSMSSNPLFLNILLVAVLPAFVEEVTFRGIMYTGYRSSVIKRAVFASAFAFGLFHMNVNQFCYAAFMGIIFSLLYEATGSIMSSMLVHFVFNANSVILERVINWVEHYVSRMAQEKEKFSGLAEQFAQSETTVTFADYTIAQKISTLLSLLTIAVIGGAIACVIMGSIAKRLHRGNHLKQTVASLFGLKAKPKAAYAPAEYVEQPKAEYGGKILDIFYIVSAVLCILMMIL